MAHDATAQYAGDVTQAELDALAPTFAIQDGRDVVTWSCPRCHAELREDFDRNDPIYQFDADTVDAPSGQGILDLVCKCGYKHPGGDGKPGCGFAAQIPVKG